ncbi:MAG: HD domain-containing protein [Oscillospiraceae bacterium]|nr:HD domain-containing protein [Oscillospiraceae bacterium]
MSRQKIKSVTPWVLFCLAGVAWNVVGARLVAFLGLPLFLDSQGTVFVAAIGGYLPGIVVGYLSNLANSTYDPISVFYCVTSVMIAGTATFFYHKGLFRKLPGLLLFVFVLAFLGGGLGSVMGWALYGFDMESGVSGALAVRIYESGSFTPFTAKLIADFTVDVADKALTVLLVLLALRFVPRRLESVLGVPVRRGAHAEINAAPKNKSLRGISLRTKIALMISGAVLLLALSASLITFLLYRQALIEQHIKLGQGVAELVASAIDPGAVDRYLEEGENAAGYREMESMLYRIRDSSPDIQYVYVYRILPDGCHVVFDLDTDDLPGSNPGDIHAFDPSFYDYLPSLLAGEPIEPIISNDFYGWLLTAYAPVYNDAGECVCYAAADTSMEKLRNYELRFLAQQISLFVGSFLLILSVTLWLTEERVIAPINAIAKAAGMFAYDSEEARAENVEIVQALDIRTGDEIENLYHAILKTATDTMRYIADSQKKAATIARMQNGLILTLADLVESRDQNTGDHVRKTAAYTEIIMKQMKRDGVYPEALTNEFIAEVVSAAPLHDMGKIHVPDAILNKPGKLNEIEFQEMKKHTVAGQDIISKVMQIDPDSEYLREARNLAAYHHEHWDGTGYPSGLAGEDIPLSARVMAVADVFDALVSRRSYKEAFPFEKAVQIIREGAGSHFDPKIVEAFLHAETEVRRVAAAFGAVSA